MTKFVATIDFRENPTLRQSLADDLGPALAELGTIKRVEPSPAKSHSLEPGTIQIIAAISGSQVLAALIKGLMDYLVQRVKKGTIKITVGSAVVELASDTTAEQIQAEVKKVQHALGTGP